MPLRWRLYLLFFSLVPFSSALSANSTSDLDTHSIEWLVSQVKLGEIQQNQLLMTDSLDKLLSIAPKNILVRCAQARVYFALNQPTKARTVINQLTDIDKKQPCVAQLTLLAQSNTEYKEQIQQARLLARAGQYQAATKIYDQLFSPLYSSIEYEFEHINWIATESERWQQALRGYQSLRTRFANVGRFELAYARHILKRKPRDKQALEIFNYYAHSNQYSVEAEFGWLNALADMPIDKKTEQAYQAYLKAFPHSSKGALQYADFQKSLKAELIKQADPAYKKWLQGAAALEKKHYAKANNLLLQALQGRPNDHDVLNSLGLLNLRQGNNSQAYSYFKKAQRNTQNIDLISVYKGLATTAKFWQYIDEAKHALTAKHFKAAQLKLDLAATLDEDPNTVSFYQGQLFQARGDYQLAMRTYQTVLKHDPLNAQVLNAMLSLTSSDNNYQRSDQFYENLTRAQQAVIAQDYKVIQSKQLRQRADELTTQGQLDTAVSLLLLAIKKTPLESWLYYDLANLYQQQGLLEHAKALYKKTLWQFPLDAELRYSHALFLRSLNDYQGALETLNFVPNNARSEEIEQLAQQLAINAKMNRLASNNNASKATVIYNLTELGAQPLTPLMQAELALQWRQINENQYAERQLNAALSRDNTLSPYWHMTYGQWLLESEDITLTKHWFVNYQLPPAAGNEQRDRWLALQAAYINKFNQGEQRISQLNALLQQHPNNAVLADALITAYIELDHRQMAIKLYQTQLQLGNTLEPQTALAVARASRELGNHELSDRIIATLVNDVSPTQTYQQQLLMTALIDYSDQHTVIPLTKALLTKSNHSQELYYQGALVAEKHQQNAYAQQWYLEAIEPYSSAKVANNPDLNYQLYTLDDDAPWYVNNAKRELARMQQQDQVYITSGVNFSSQTSTQSDASLGAGSMPIEIGFPLWQGTGIVKLDPMTISSQETRFDESFSGSRYGQGALCILDCPLNSIEPQQEGIDIGLAWFNDTWRFDIGTTPIGFLVEDIVWGIDYNGDFGNFGYRLTLNKRPLTSSVLSYAGLEDVFTNEVWGGVRATSLRFNLSHDLGLDWGFWASTDFQLLQGKNVKENQRYSLMGGAYNRYIREKNTELTLGANLLHWSYQYNLSEETFGHGGYYSPQNYIGVSLPVIYDRRVNNDFIYRLRAGISWSTTTTDDSEFFPNDPLLQQQAIVRGETTTGISPIFEGDTNSGISYNLGGSFEYRYTPHWFFGGFFSLDRADFYEPNYAQLYFRYYFKPVYSEMIFPGTPVVPYADY
ncbi:MULTISPECIES: cellulose synthase subunit BcsC-related outer membrane protein [Pseudoalteromonas]|uniref:cellulose synthase subunit BcsC-related outer membrane protein n=1 Tax=Pseudoalteromonas TaxID=53246 RepID=UPI00036CF18A|nr:MULTISPECIES: cellulose synthase subunit BcsC-related outer membrane protein [Pseudoalteromonas]